MPGSGLLVGLGLLGLASAGGRCRRACFWSTGLAGARRCRDALVAGLAIGPARSRGADPVGDVAALSLGILARHLGRDHRRSNAPCGDALSSPTFWWGVGPGNFAGPYLKYKLPQSSEEILDPHNLFLEVWATGGFWALLALTAALILAFWNVLGPPSEPEENAQPDRADRRHRRFQVEMAMGEKLERTAGNSPARYHIAATDLADPLGGRWLGRRGDTRAAEPLPGRPLLPLAHSGAGWMAAVFLGAHVWNRLPIPASRSVPVRSP